MLGDLGLPIYFQNILPMFSIDAKLRVCYNACAGLRVMGFWGVMKLKDVTFQVREYSDAEIAAMIESRLSSHGLDSEGLLLISAVGGEIPLELNVIPQYFSTSASDRNRLLPAAALMNIRSLSDDDLIILAFQENRARNALLFGLNDFLKRYRSSNRDLTVSLKDSIIKSRSRLNTYLRRYDAFRVAFDAINDEFVDGAERAMYDRGVNGVSKGIYYQGDCVATEQVYSDSLLINFLQANRPEVYNRPNNQVTVKPEILNNDMTKDELMSALRNRGLPSCVQFSTYD
jgi:hypothetical protein